MIICEHKIAIIMATYNGERFLAEQIESIINQSEKDWKLYIRDDGSQDKTIEIIQEYSQKDSRIINIEDKETHLGPGKSFFKALEQIDAELYMFSDQDDFWLPDKIEVSLNAYNSIKESKTRPIIVHTDISVTDENLNIIRKSRWDDVNLDPNKLKSYNYLAQYCYTQGCTLLFNNSAKKLAIPIADYASMHDWWISTRCIKAGGIIESVYTPTMLYRQHSNNVVGMHYDNIDFFSRKKEGLKNNIKRYSRLKQDGYGSLLKYIFYKFLLKVHTSRKHRR